MLSATFRLPALVAATMAAANPFAAIPAQAESAFTANLAVERIFSSLDLNGDANIDISERAALRDRRFIRLDANADGMISAAEAAQAQSQIQQRARVMEDLLGLRLANLDQNADGAVTRAEFTGSAPPTLPLDTNADGLISKPEMRAAIIALPAFE